MGFFNFSSVFFSNTHKSIENTDRLPYKFHYSLIASDPRDKSSVSQDLSTSDDTPQVQLVTWASDPVCVCVFMLSQVPLLLPCGL